jgi:hypothetical protein
MPNKRLLAFTAISLLTLSCAQGGDQGGTGGNTGTGGTSSSTGGTPGTGGITTSTGGVPGTGGSATGGIVGIGGHTGGSGGATGGTGGAHATGGAGGHAGSGPTGGSGGASPGTGGSPAGGASGGGAASSENSGAGSCTASAGALLASDNKKFPNPFALHDGTLITTKKQWQCRRQEIMQDLYKYEIGPKPDPAESKVSATFSGGTLTVNVMTKDGSMTLTSKVSGSGSCILITMDSAPSLVTGCTTVPFTSNQVVKNEQDSNQYQTDPYYKVYPSLWKMIGNYSAWSWGVSRLIDGIEQVKDQMKVDTTKIAVHGCSYAGKMALFAGALDERVALTVVEESGGGGIDSWRMSQEYTDRSGVNVEKIDNTNYGWFMPSMQKLDPYKLPHDHHELIGLVAPRAVIILGNDKYDWLGDESGYKSTMAAIEIYKSMGASNAIGYDFTSNHNHCVPPTTQQNSVSAFTKRFLQDGTTDPNIAIKPPTTSYDLNYMAQIDWTTPTLQ